MFKALSAVKLARQLVSEGIPAVPVFWLATEDHDLAEVNHAWVFNGDITPAKVGISPAADPNQPVGTIPLGDVPIQQLRAALDGLPFSDEVVASVGAAYSPAATMGQAFAALVKDILKDYPILFIDPMCLAVRDLGAPMIRQALDAAPRTDPRPACPQQGTGKSGLPRPGAH